MRATPRVTTSIASVVVVVVSGFLLVTGSPVLERSVPGLDAFPMGSLIAWAAIIALPMAIYSAIARLHPPRGRGDRVMAVSMKAMVSLAVVWLPVSYWLAGNLAFNFGGEDGFRGSENAFFLFLYYSLALVGAPVAVLLLYAVFKLVARFGPTGNRADAARKRRAGASDCSR